MQKSFRGRRALVVLAVPLLLLAVVGFAAQPLLERRARALVEKTLQGHTHPDQVAKLKVELHLWQGRVVVRDLEVAPEPGEQASSESKTRISYSVPEFELDVSLWRLLYGHVQLEKVRFLHPHVHLEVHEREKRGKGFDMQQAIGQVRQALSGYMSTIGVGDLEIVDATMEYVLPLDTGEWGFTLEHLDLELRGLVVDKGLLDAPGQMPLDELRIAFGSENFVSRDGRSRFHVDRFALSLAGDSIFIGGLRGEVVPKEDTAHAGRSPMRLAMAELRFHGLGLEKALGGDTLEAQRITLVHPDVRADLLLKKGHGRTHDTVLTTHRLLSELLPPMRLDTLDIVQGRIDLVQGDRPLLSIGRIDARILDTRSAGGNKGAPFSPPRAGMLFFAQVKGTNGGSTLAVDSVRLAISPRDLDLHGVSMQAQGDVHAGAPDIDVSHMALRGFGLAAWMAERAVEVDTLAIRGVELRLPSPFHADHPKKPERHAPIKQARVPLPAALERSGISRLRVKELSLDGSWALTGHAHAELTGNAEQFAFRAQGVRCPEEPEEPHRDLYADRAELRMHGVRFDDKAGALALQMGDLVAGTADRSIRLRDVRMCRASKSGAVVNTDELLLEGFDLPALLEERGLMFRKLRINNRELKVELAEAPPDSNAAPAAMPVIGRYFHADTIDIRTGSLLVERSGAVVATVDSFHFEVFKVRPDPPHFRETRLAFLKEGPRYSGRRLRIAPPGSGIRASVEQFDVDLVAYRAEARDIAVHLDRPGLRVDAAIPAITSTRFVPEFVETTDVLALGHLVINDARIDVVRTAVTVEQRSADTRANRKRRSPPYSLIHAGGLELRNARLSIAMEGADKARKVITGTLNTTLGAFDQRLIPDGKEPLRIASTRSTMDRLTIAGPGEQDTLFAFSDVEVRTDAIVRGVDERMRVDGLHVGIGPFDLAYAHDSMRCHVGGVRYDHEAATLLVHAISLRPAIAQEAFASGQRYRTDALVVEIDTVLAAGLDVRSVIAEKKYVVPHLLVSGVRVNDLRDHRLPFAPYREKPLPSKLLRNMAQHVGVDTIDVRGMTVAYAEIAKDGLGTGRIGLSQMRIRILGVNTPSRRRDAPLTVKASGLLQDRARFALDLRFEPGHERDLFRYRFDLGPMDLGAFNAMLAPAAHLTITRGVLDTLTVIAECNNDVAIGEVQMYFDDLHLMLTGKKAQGGKVIFPRMESWVANEVVRTHRRPDQGDDPSTVYFERLKDRSLFNYLIKTTISGIPGALRLPDEKGKAQRSDEQELKELFREEQQSP